MINNDFNFYVEKAKILKDLESIYSSLEIVNESEEQVYLEFILGKIWEGFKRFSGNILKRFSELYAQAKAEHEQKLEELRKKTQNPTGPLDQEIDEIDNIFSDMENSIESKNSDLLTQKGALLQLLIEKKQLLEELLKKQAGNEKAKKILQETETEITTTEAALQELQKANIGIFGNTAQQLQKNFYNLLFKNKPGKNAKLREQLGRLISIIRKAENPTQIAAFINLFKKFNDIVLRNKQINPQK